MLEANEGSHGIAPLPLTVTHSTAWHRELTIQATVGGAKASQSWANFTARAAGRDSGCPGWRFLPAEPGPPQPPTSADPGPEVPPQEAEAATWSRVSQRWSPGDPREGCGEPECRRPWASSGDRKEGIRCGSSRGAVQDGRA